MYLGNLRRFSECDLSENDFAPGMFEEQATEKTTP
jgi:hypothetical protein